MAWVETSSRSFVARHDSDKRDAARGVLEQLEEFRATLAEVFEHTPDGVSVIIHPSPAMLALAAPWLPFARAVSAPAGRRYLAGWFAAEEIHVLSPAALERRASNVAGSREALLLSARHEYAHLVLGANNPSLPPPFSPAAFRRYVRAAWLCEGAAAYLAGQVPHMRAAIARRMHEGAQPALPPPARDAWILGGSVYGLLDRERGRAACLELARTPASLGGREAIEGAFERPLAAVERSWVDYLASLTMR
ncbi:MAG: hypothetical protein ACR2GL_02845 [Thermoleophilaceae bacterium]